MVYIIHNNETLTVSAAELIEAARAGVITPWTLVSVDGENWSPADTFDALNQAFTDCAIIDATAMGLL